MNSGKHLAQAEIVLAGMRKLSLADDYLAVVDGAMVAGYHLGNALLHAHGVSAESEHTNTPSKLTCAIDSLPERARAGFMAFAELEKLRSDHVRSSSVYEQGIEGAVWRNLEAMRDACGPETKPQAPSGESPKA
jgi:hypothetical protein